MACVRDCNPDVVWGLCLGILVELLFLLAHVEDNLITEHNVAGQ